MSGPFADTFYFLALLNPCDAAHSSAHAISAGLSGRVVTTDFVLLELADALGSRASREQAARFVAAVRADADFVVVPATRDLFDRGLRLYEQRTDKDWSLTDCTSFVVMRDQGLSQALTGDHHFEQAGFTVLLK